MRGGGRSSRRKPRGGKDGEETKTGGQKYEDKSGSNPFADKKPGDGPQNEKYGGNRNARSARPKTGDQLQDGERPRNNKTPRQKVDEGE